MRRRKARSLPRSTVHDQIPTIHVNADFVQSRHVTDEALLPSPSIAILADESFPCPVTKAHSKVFQKKNESGPNNINGPIPINNKLGFGEGVGPEVWPNKSIYPEPFGPSASPSIPTTQAYNPSSGPAQPPTPTHLLGPPGVFSSKPSFYNPPTKPSKAHDPTPSLTQHIDPATISHPSAAARPGSPCPPRSPPTRNSSSTILPAQKPAHPTRISASDPPVAPHFTTTEPPISSDPPSSSNPPAPLPNAGQPSSSDKPGPSSSARPFSYAHITRHPPGSAPQPISALKSYTFDASKVCPLGSLNSTHDKIIVSFSTSDVDILAESWDHTLIFKFSHAIPSPS